jgi:quercetin dioxygenase-like cupin family protein
MTALQVGLNPGQSCRRPGHDAPSEVFLIVQQGQIELEVESQTMALKSGDSARLDGRSGRLYSCQGDGPAMVLEVRSESNTSLTPEA